MDQQRLAQKDLKPYIGLGLSMKFPALRRQFAQQVGEVNQVLGDQMAAAVRVPAGSVAAAGECFAQSRHFAWRCPRESPP